jgi:hypothetical protein
MYKKFGCKGTPFFAKSFKMYFGAKLFLCIFAALLVTIVKW